MSYLKSYVDEVSAALKNAVATDENGKTTDFGLALGRWAERANLASREKATVFFCGNGASATMAEHISHDCFQNADLNAYTVSETSHITAIGNDISYEQVFAYRIGKMCSGKDMLVTISSSGNSPNVLAAQKTAREKGMFIVTISGKEPDNRSRQGGDLNFYVPLGTYGLVESAHAVLLHCWLDFYLDMYKGGRH